MSASSIDVFHAACEHNDEGWIFVPTNDNGLRKYASKSSGIEFDIQMTEARLHLHFIRSDFADEQSWVGFFECVNNNETEWKPLNISFWDNTKLLSSDIIAGDIPERTVSMVDFFTPLFDISEEDKLSEYTRICFEAAGLVVDRCGDQTLSSEGETIRRLATRYERSAFLRKRAIEIHGSNCSVCGISFGGVYGEIGKGFIHVHHLERLADTGKRLVNPASDLVPVCPNCHSMLHRKNPPLLPEELKKLMGVVV